MGEPSAAAALGSVALEASEAVATARAPVRRNSRRDCGAKAPKVLSFERDILCFMEIPYKKPNRNQPLLFLNLPPFSQLFTFLGASFMECGGRAKRRHRFGLYNGA